MKFAYTTIDRYGNRPNLGGIELMNEPVGVNLESLKKYYEEAYEAVRKHNPSAYVIMSNPLDADSKVLLSFVKAFDRVVIDVHYYNLFSDMFNNMSVQQNIDYIRKERASDLSGVSSSNALSFVGKKMKSSPYHYFSFNIHTLKIFTFIFILYFIF